MPSILPPVDPSTKGYLPLKNTSPVCSTLAFSNRTTTSVSVCAGGTCVTASRSPFASSLYPSLKTRWGRASVGEGGKSSSSTARWCGWVIRSLVFSCATSVAPPARSGALLSVWSKCQCVLITVFTGAPNPLSDSWNLGHAGATNVSTTTRPSEPCSTTTLPPGPASKVTFLASG